MLRCFLSLTSKVRYNPLLTVSAHVLLPFVVILSSLNRLNCELINQPNYGSDIQTSQKEINKTPAHEFMSESERILLFGHESADPVYEVFEPKGLLKRNHFNSYTKNKRKHVKVRRSIEAKGKNENKTFPSEVSVNFRAFGESFRLRLKRNYRLLSSTFIVKEQVVTNKSHHHQDQDQDEDGDEDVRVSKLNCFYHGYSISHPNSSAALSMCDGMRGIIETQSAIYVINPLPRSARTQYNLANNHTVTSRPHIVLKKESLDNYQCPHQRRAQPSTTPSPVSAFSYPEILSSFATHLRRRRSIRTDYEDPSSTPKPVTVETAVFVDENLYEIMRRTFPTDTEQEIVTYVLTIMNAVQLLFKQPSLGRTVDISVVLMDILKVQPRDLASSDNIDTYLTNFCVWQHNKRIHSRGLTPRWDHALLLSGINMYVVDGHGRKKRHVVGLAPVSGMCNSLNSCTISEGTSFQTVLVAGHEMGHSLGMEHDGNQDGNACDQDNFIMSPTLGAGKTSWSGCSRDYLEKFLRTPQASCILASSSHVNILHQFTSQYKLPGQLFDTNQQCALRFGGDSRKSQLQPLEDVCRLLRCDTGSSRNTVAYHAHPALEGTVCGRDKWCREGSCIPIEIPAQASNYHPVTSEKSAALSTPNAIDTNKKKSHAIDGQWGSWASFGSCSSECIIRSNTPAVGVMIAIRKCDNPFPINGGKNCEGSDKRAKLCDASQVCSASSSYRMVTAAEYINDICTIASRRDNNLESRGTQYPSYDHSHSCYVWCHKRGGGYMTQGWKLPDGTPCGKEPPRSGSNRYCVNGECRSFDCNGYSSESANTEPCPLPSVGYPITSGISGTKGLGWGPWLPLTSCHYSCLINSKGARLVTRDCNSIANCLGRKESFQLCSNSEDNCLASSVKSAEQYSNEVCQKYRIKYPTLLSGRGRQLAPRSENPHSSCIVACQDRVWRDIHYQMDAFEDGKFPLGTDCSIGNNSRFKAHCVNGKCVKFDESSIPTDEDVDDYQHVRYFLSHELRYRNRHRRSINGFRTFRLHEQDNKYPEGAGWQLMQGSSRAMPSWRPIRPQRPLHFSAPIEQSADLNNTVLRLDPYIWGMSISECSSPCGEGYRNIVVFCHAGRFMVEDSLCDVTRKPAQSGSRICNKHPCRGRWRSEDWGPCSASCGSGFRTRSVACVHKTSDTNLYSLTAYNSCSPSERPKQLQICGLPPCPAKGERNHL